MLKIILSPINIQLVNDDDGYTFSSQNVSNKGIVAPHPETIIPINLFSTQEIAETEDSY